MTQAINQFAQGPVKGQLDPRLNLSTISCEVYASESVALLPGQAVKMVDSAGGVPKVTTCTVDEDDVFGFVNYSIKDSDFGAGDPVEVSIGVGNIMYMEASAAIARNAKVMIVPSGQKVATATSTNTIIGRALDKAAADGDLIRVAIYLPGITA